MAIHAGNRGLPEFGISEAIARALKKPLTAQGGSNLFGSSQAQAPAPQPQPGPTENLMGSAPIGPKKPAGTVLGTSTSRPSSGGGGPAAVNIPETPGVNLSGLRDSANEASQRALAAALGVYDQRKQGILNKIPTLQSQRELALRGLDEGFQSFQDTANAEEGKRVTGLQQEGQQIGEEYGRGERKTRAAAKSLSRALRNQFAAAGSLDSTMYQDRNIEQSREVAQSIGDLGREKAGKLTANTREQEDIKQYYATQRLQEQKRIQLEKERITAETDGLIQSTLDDANLSDAQKIEAVENANARLESRLGEIDLQEQQLNQSAQRNSQEVAMKMAELGQKGYSDQYTQTKAKQQALTQAAAIIDGFAERFNQPISSDQAAKVFMDLGFSEEESTFYGNLYGGKQPFVKGQESGKSVTSGGLNLDAL